MLAMVLCTLASGTGSDICFGFSLIRSDLMEDLFPLRYNLAPSVLRHGLHALSLMVFLLAVQYSRRPLKVAMLGHSVSAADGRLRSTVAVVLFFYKLAFLLLSFATDETQRSFSFVNF